MLLHPKLPFLILAPNLAPVGMILPISQMRKTEAQWDQETCPSTWNMGGSGPGLKPRCVGPKHLPLICLGSRHITFPQGAAICLVPHLNSNKGSFLSPHGIPFCAGGMAKGTDTKCFPHVCTLQIPVCHSMSARTEPGVTAKVAPPMPAAAPCSPTVLLPTAFYIIEETSGKLNQY